MYDSTQYDDFMGGALHLRGSSAPREMTVSLLMDSSRRKSELITRSRGARGGGTFKVRPSCGV